MKGKNADSEYPKPGMSLGIGNRLQIARVHWGFDGRGLEGRKVTGVVCRHSIKR
jgi:hypothetical protein